MESYFRVSADAADTDKRLRREYMRFVWRKRRAYLPGFVFSLVILFVIAPVSAFLAAGRGGYELLFVGIACLLYMLLLPNIASSMLGRGRRAAGAVYDFTSDSVVLHGGGGEEEATSYSDITEIVELPRMFVLFAGGKGRRPFQRKLLFRAKPKPSPRSSRCAAAERSPRFPTDAGGAPFSQSARSFLPR